MCELFAMDEPLTIRALRTDLGLTLDQMAEKLALSSKGQLSQIERGAPCSVRVALAIEALSCGRVNASDLNEDVRLSREAVHAVADTARAAPASPGNAAPDCPSQQSEAA